MSAAIPTIPIGKLIEKVVSWNPPRDAPDDEFNYIDLSSVDNTTKQVTANQTVVGSEAPSRARQRVKAGDILVSTVRPNLNGVARVPDQLDGATASTGFCVLRPQVTKLDASYLFHWVQSAEFVGDMMRKATGASYPAVSDKIIAQSEIPLLPLDEQKRIAAILDQADELRRNRQRAINRLNQLGQAIFQEMFERAEHFPTKEVADFAYVKGGKRLPKGAEYLPEPSPHPYIRVSDLNGVGIDVEQIKYISPETQSAVRRYVVHSGDVVISIAGTIGVTAAVPDFLDGANLTENAAKITPKPGTEFDPTYVAWALRMPTSRSQILASTGQVTIGKLALFRIEKITIPMPDIKYQKVFSNAIAKIDLEIANFQRHFCQTERLFSSLQHRAFRGEL